MKRNIIIIMAGAVLLFGCARVKVGGTKDPIKVDMNVTMRVDVYQHVEKDLNSIEDIVSGSKPVQSKAGDKSSLLGFFMPEAYAQEGLSKDVEDAALRRRDRRAELIAWEEKGVVGEDKSGLVEIRTADKADGKTRELVNAENADRMLIYQAVAKKNGTSVEEAQKLNAKRLQQDAPLGAPIEVFNPASQSSSWQTK